LNASPNITRVIKSRRMGWTGHVTRIGKTRNVFKILVGKPEQNKPIGRSRCRQEDNIKMHLREIGENGNEPSGSIKGGEFLDSLSDYQLLNEDSAPWSYLVVGLTVA
jgi:hypothetical protein